MKRVIHGIDAISRPLLHEASLLQPSLPLVEGFGDDLEVGVSQKKTYNCAVHLRLLLLRLSCNVVTDVVLSVALSSQEVPQRLNISPNFVPLKHYVSLGIDGFCKSDPV